jgi:hypothetical protein
MSPAGMNGFRINKKGINAACCIDAFFAVYTRNIPYLARIIDKNI